MSLQSRVLALLGLAVLGYLGLRLVTGAMTVPEAALRIAVALGVLLVVDKIGVPLARTLVGPSTPPAPPGDEPPTT